MNKNFKKFSDICNAHKGIIELMVLIVAVIAVLIDNLHKLSSLNLFPKIINILGYNIVVPIYLILIIISLIYIYINRIIR